MNDVRKKWILTAILAAIEVFLTGTHLGYFAIGSTAFTVLHIPVFIAAILAGARYVATAIFMSNTSSWSAELFREGLNYVGPNLLIASIAALVAGVAFLVYGLLKDGKKTDK